MGAKEQNVTSWQGDIRIVPSILLAAPLSCWLWWSKLTYGEATRNRRLAFSRRPAGNGGVGSVTLKDPSSANSTEAWAEKPEELCPDSWPADAVTQRPVVAVSSEVCGDLLCISRYLILSLMHRKCISAVRFIVYFKGYLGLSVGTGWPTRMSHTKGTFVKSQTLKITVHFHAWINFRIVIYRLHPQIVHKIC